MINIPNLFVQASIPAIVVLVLWLLRKLFRIRPDQMSEDTIHELDERFANIKWIPPLAMVLVGIAFAFGIHGLLVAANHWLAMQHSSDLQMFPQSSIWWFFPGFGALVFSWEITLQLWALFGDRRTANLYATWSNVTTTMGSWGAYGMDSRRVLRIFAIVIAFPIGVFTVLAIPMHATVGPTAIVDCSYGFKGCHTYQLRNARRITAIRGFRTRDGNLTFRAGLVVDFANGEHWSSADWGDFQRQIDPALASYLTRQTGLPIGHAPTEADIPPMP